MADYRNFCVFDFETGSTDTETTQIIQIGASIIHRNSLEIVDSFRSLVKPKDFDALEDGALAVNHITKEQLEDAPDVDVIFPTWANWIKEWNTNKDKNGWGAPIPCGWGSDRFDVPIMSRYCKMYGYWDEKYDNMNLLDPQQQRREELQTGYSGYLHRSRDRG
jgi:DNA polymerase III epsilon subunit-like protein